ncbi:MAG: hypothetical protein U0T56_07975 [Ferruginibacter sp.]
MLITIRNAAEKQNLVTETKEQRERSAAYRRSWETVPLIRKIKETIDKVAPTDARILHNR